MLKVTALATLVAGTLDILFAVILTLLHGREPADMLRSVASGPFPAATGMAASGAVLGLVVHFALMAAMAAIFVAIARLRPAILRTPYLAALAYGLVTYFAMNWLVVPLRFGTPLPPRTLSIATQLFAHIVLVGLPLALIARYYLLPRARRI
jgi:hypothetical protein